MSAMDSNHENKQRRSCGSDASPCSRRLLAALLKPTIEMMRDAGISRMACGSDKSFVLQMEDGKVITIDQPT